MYNLKGDYGGEDVLEYRIEMQVYDPQIMNTVGPRGAEI